MGEVIPTMVVDTLPGDRFSFSSENMLRFMPLVAPIMHKVDVNAYSFFVPNRILWAEWEEWIIRKSDVEAPYMMLDVIEVGSLCDYLGYPTGVVTGLKLSVIPIAGYLKIWNEYFRDENLQDEYVCDLVPGDNTADFSVWADTQPLRASWKADYFNKALPFAQQGDTVMVPLVDEQNILVEYDNPTHVPGAFKQASNDGLAGGNIVQSAGPSPFSFSAYNDGNPVAYDPRGTLNVDVQEHATDINTLRWAVRMQEWLERNIRGGTRMVEYLLSHFGVRSSDARIQRPEFIGMTSQNMIISEVLSTAQTVIEDTGAPLGQMGGHGISVGGGNRMSHFCEEHGYIFSVICVRPKTAYQQGLHRSLSRFSPFDYAWPTFAHLGEQEVKQKEIYAETATPELTFGYVPRYAEYKFHNSRVSGEMKTTLKDWHLGIIYGSDPALNSALVECNPRTDIFAVTDLNEDHIICHVFNNVYVRRALPKYGIPSL